VLEAMRFLRACGLPAGGVHSGNVMLFKVRSSERVVE